MCKETCDSTFTLSSILFICQFTQKFYEWKVQKTQVSQVEPFLQLEINIQTLQKQIYACTANGIDRGQNKFLT